MTSPVRGKLLAVAVAGAVCVSGGCGESKEEAPNEQIRQLEIQSRAAYNCMPNELRRELRVMERQHDARIRQLARKNVPGAGVGATAAQERFQQIVEQDPRRSRLLRKARGIYRRYLPGGADFDARCYLREREKARNRIESAGTTGS
jgi:hypothetical protein